MRVIGIAGRSGSGKTTAAGFLAAALVDRGYTVGIDAFAYLIKWVMRSALFHRRGDDDCAWREKLQHMGAGYRAQDPDIFLTDMARRNNFRRGWCKIGGRNIWQACTSAQPDFLIISDVRYRNEAELCRDNGVLIGISGSLVPLEGKAAEHETEREADAVLAICDYHLPHHNGLEALKTAIQDVVRENIATWEENDERTGGADGDVRRQGTGGFGGTVRGGPGGGEPHP